jgi:hypothetical protein
VKWSKSILALSFAFFVVTMFLTSASAKPMLALAAHESRLASVSGSCASAMGHAQVQAAENNNRTWTVSKSGTADFQTIQEAINAAGPGDTILVQSGTYCEDVVVNKTVSIIGQDKCNTTIDGGYADNTVWITSNDVQISGFTITDGALCNVLIGASTMAKRVVVTDNFICNASHWGIVLVLSNYDRIEGNIIQSHYGPLGPAGSIELAGSSVNVIVGNTIEDGDLGISCTWSKDLAGDMTVGSLDNIIYHNSFVRNAIQVETDGYSANAWDDGVSGNYWSDYNGTDLNHDGIGDFPYFIDGNNVDDHPLMGVFSSFNTASGEQVSVVSNSTVDDFTCFESNKTIVLHVSNTTADQTYGFYRLTIPHDVIPPPYNVTVNGNPVGYTTLYENESLSIIYFSYEHSTPEITITPEFPSPIILLLVMMTALLAVSVLRRFRTRGDEVHRRKS